MDESVQFSYFVPQSYSHNPHRYRQSGPDFSSVLRLSVTSLELDSNKDSLTSGGGNKNTSLSPSWDREQGDSDLFVMHGGF